jgi:hypothetical protein
MPMPKTNHCSIRKLTAVLRSVHARRPADCWGSSLLVAAAGESAWADGGGGGGATASGARAVLASAATPTAGPGSEATGADGM